VPSAAPCSAAPSTPQATQRRSRSSERRVNAAKRAGRRGQAQGCSASSDAGAAPGPATAAAARLSSRVPLALRDTSSLPASLLLSTPPQPPVDFLRRSHVLDVHPAGCLLLRPCSPSAAQQSAALARPLSRRAGLRSCACFGLLLRPISAVPPPANLDASWRAAMLFRRTGRRVRAFPRQAAPAGQAHIARPR
jgi:hypothetical protein